MEIKRFSDDIIDYKINMCNPKSSITLITPVFVLWNWIKGKTRFDISNMYEDFEEIQIMKANEHVLDYNYLISELSKKFKVIMIGEDFGLSHLSYLLGMSGYYHLKQLKTNIEYGQFYPSMFSLGIEKSKLAFFEEELRRLDVNENNGSYCTINPDEIKKDPKTVTVTIHLVDTNRFRLLTDSTPDYSGLPFPEIKADTIYDLVGDETNVYLIGEDSAKLIEPLLAMFKPRSFAELEQVCSLLLASKETADTILRRKASGFSYWASYLSRESFARFIFGIDGYYDNAVRLMSRMRRGMVSEDHIAKLKSIGTSDDVINDILAMRHIARRSYAADLARIVWRSQLEKNAITELYDFRPFSEGLHTDVREHKILDRIPCTEEGMKAVKDYLKCNDSCQARERLRKISEELSRRRFAGI